jgi:hypothetical protein
MRTLNGILGMTQMLRRSTTNPAQLPQLAVIEQSSRHLNTVIGDLLDLSKIEAGRLVIESGPARLESLVREVTDLLEPLASQKGLRFEVTRGAGLPPWIDADAARLKQVLHNLIGNAIKFTTAGQVTLTSVRTRLAGLRGPRYGIGTPPTRPNGSSCEQSPRSSPVHRAGIEWDDDFTRSGPSDALACRHRAGPRAAVPSFDSPCPAARVRPPTCRRPRPHREPACLWPARCCWSKTTRSMP